MMGMYTWRTQHVIDHSVEMRDGSSSIIFSRTVLEVHCDVEVTFIVLPTTNCALGVLLIWLLIGINRFLICFSPTFSLLFKFIAYNG